MDSTGMHEEDFTLYLALVDGRMKSAQDIENLPVAIVDGHPLRIGDVARVERGPEPVYNAVTAEGVRAVLINIRSHHNGSTLDIANALKAELKQLRADLPPDMKIAYFYDQSLLVRGSVKSVWEAILFGLVLSVVIIFFFLKNWGTRSQPRS